MIKYLAHAEVPNIETADNKVSINALNDVARLLDNPGDLEAKKRPFMAYFARCNGRCSDAV
jgi:hypothetical protein